MGVGMAVDAPGGPDGGKARRERLFGWLGWVGGTGGIAAALGADLSFRNRLLLFIGVLVAVPLVMTLGLTLRDRVPKRDLPRAFLRRLGRICALLLHQSARAIPAILATVLVWTAVHWSFVTNGASGKSCEPADVRVTVSPESLTALKAAAHRYVEDKSGDGCRKATITMTANSSISDLREGFANGWLEPGVEGDTSERVPMLGPRPDLWIPQTTLAAKDVIAHLDEAQGDGQGDGLREKALLDLDEKKTAGTSPMVVASLSDAYRGSGSTGPEGLQSVLNRLRQQGVLDPLARALPDTSESALAATPALYQALASGDGAAERFLNKDRLVPGDATALLCRFREQSSAPPGGIAVVVPENTLADYARNKELGTACPPLANAAAAKRLVPYYTEELPVLDHPIVQVRWPGEDSEKRRAAISEFRDWLASHPPTEEGFRDANGSAPTGPKTALGVLTDPTRNNAVPPRMPPHEGLKGAKGCVESLKAARACYEAARPNAVLTLAFDISGSMGQTAKPALPRAQDIAQRIVAAARTRDQIRWATFSSPAPVAFEQPVTIATGPKQQEQKNALQAGIRKITLRGGDRALADAVDSMRGTLRPGVQHLVVLTDGQTARTNAGARYSPGKLAERLRGDKAQSDLRVLVVSVGPDGCSAGPAKAIGDAVGEPCIDGSAGTAADAAGKIISSVIESTPS
ncbi:VWA domain-containing protein [Actinomadura syzygii]|uniref:VWA domain-containing protein n=2 Tax=Actinomadura syzygii TaxID=1427538 RepID=A0A5D0UM94_9ACTN|nr:VWA domain-containing protein [Actinomadura syzygii]